MRLFQSVFALLLAGCAAPPAPPVASSTPTRTVPATLLRQLDNADEEIKKHDYRSAARHSEDLLKQLKLFEQSQDAQIRAHQLAAEAYIGSKRKNKAVPHYRALVHLEPARAAEYKAVLWKLGH
ncbi:MAG: hypothetical protein J0I12_17430 [Candidatus Eremiobacteraeota bacterium]|nr:hypothetical protein [Candidatus Eremiobacteraeota bacterium]